MKCRRIHAAVQALFATQVFHKKDTQVSRRWCTMQRMNRQQQHMRRLRGNGWTMAAISRASDVSRSTLYRVDNGADASESTIKAVLAVRGYPPARAQKEGKE
jgi:lambda repressor-like predicted transcriptional regulator